MPPLAMADNTTTDDLTARVVTLEGDVAELKDMVAKLSAAVIDTAQASGYRVRHINLARDALQLGYIDYRDFM